MAIAGVSSSLAYQPPPRLTPTVADQAAQQQAAPAIQAFVSNGLAGAPASDLGGPAGVQDALSRVASAQGNAQSQAQTSQDQTESASSNASPVTSAASVASAASVQSSGFVAYGANGAAQDYGSGLPRGNSYNAVA